MTVTKVPLPVYTLLLKDSSGPVFLRQGNDLWLPIFTSLEYATNFVTCASLDCVIHTLASGDDIKRFIVNPPSRSTKPSPAFLIVVDPVDPKAGTEFTVFRPEQFLGATNQ